MERELSILRSNEYSIRYNLYDTTFQSSQVEQYIQSQNQQIKDKQDELNKISEYIANAEQEKAQCEGKLGGVKAKIADYEYQRENLNKQLAQIDKQLKEIADKKWELGKIIMAGIPAPEFGYFCHNGIANCTNHPLEKIPRQTNEAEIKAAEQRIENAKKEIASLEEKEQDLYREQSKIWLEINDINYKEMQEKTILAELESQISNLTYDIDRNKEYYKNGVNDLENLNVELEKNLESYNAYQSNIYSLEAELNNVQAKISQLEFQIAEARAESYRRQNAGYNPTFWPYIYSNYDTNNGSNNNQPDNSKSDNNYPNRYQPNNDADTRTTEAAANEVYNEMEQQNNTSNSEGSSLFDKAKDAFDSARQEFQHAREQVREALPNVAAAVTSSWSNTGDIVNNIGEGLLDLAIGIARRKNLITEQVKENLHFIKGFVMHEMIDKRLNQIMNDANDLVNDNNNRY